VPFPIADRAYKFPQSHPHRRRSLRPAASTTARQTIGPEPRRSR
jgi:hypothetical protein